MLRRMMEEAKKRKKANKNREIKTREKVMIDENLWGQSAHGLVPPPPPTSYPSYCSTCLFMFSFLKDVRFYLRTLQFCSISINLKFSFFIAFFIPYLLPFSY